ncbi:MAG: hypothetical protein OEZ02_13305 [Anaerolineae bacterium]|nr:hypothetical protein [Anaerolineae bacterium]
MTQTRKEKIKVSLDKLRQLEDRRRGLEPKLLRAQRDYKAGMWLSAGGMLLLPLWGFFLLVALAGSAVILFNGVKLSRLNRELDQVYSQMDSARMRIDILSGRTAP